MKKISSTFGYFLLSNVVFIIDRISKQLAMTIADTVSVMPCLSFTFVKNRGISWGMFYASNTCVFVCMTGLITVVIGTLGVYTYRKWQSNQSIVGEVLVLTGALSNLIDRIFYCGVIDFIEFSYKVCLFQYSILLILQLPVALRLCLSNFGEILRL